MSATDAASPPPAVDSSVIDWSACTVSIDRSRLDFIAQALNDAESAALKSLAEMTPPTGAPNGGLVPALDAERVVLKLVSHLRLVLDCASGEAPG